MQHFQPILIVIGILAIVGVLIHGYLLSRKENIILNDDSLLANIGQNDPGIVVLAGNDCEQEKIDDIHIDNDIIIDESCDFSMSSEIDAVEDINFSTQDLTEDLDDDFLAPLTEQTEEIVESIVVNNDSPLEDTSVATEPTTEPTISIPQDEQDLFIFNVVAVEGVEVSGHELLQFFLTAGFRFGEMSIFHRHLHSNGTGPVLFSIANMMAPGIFEPENMEQFRSQGVSFFLTAPNNKINIKQAFDMMLLAVEQMAEEFDCVVLNEQREPMTETQFRSYHERLLRYM